MLNDASQTSPELDVVIIGDGVIGLSTALELAIVGAQGHVLGVRHDGAASGAAAGLLAPSIGTLTGPVRAAFDASLDRYPAFIERLREADPDVTLIAGLLQVSATTRATHATPPAKLLSREDVERLEPSVSAPLGGVLHPRDAAVDSVRLTAAIAKALDRRPGMTVTRDDPAVELVVSRDAPTSMHVRTRGGRTIAARTVVLAAGAWSPTLAGLPRSLPIVPLKGQMLALRSSCLHHPVAGDEVYLVPRGDEVVVGATVEHAGFDISVDPAAIERLRLAAVRLCPPLAGAPVTRSWAGIRPATPDMLPIIGPDPDVPALIYACGHSKNGILLAPETAAIVARLVMGQAPGRDLAPFAVTRFAG